MTNAHSIELFETESVVMDAEYETLQFDISPETTAQPEEEEPTTQVPADSSSSSSDTSDTSGRECVICYDSLSSTKNLCITECGHEFCFSCMMKHVQRNNGCPCCRAVIIEDIEDSDESDDDESDEGSDSDDDSNASDEDDDDDDDEDDGFPIERLEEAFVAKGYGLKDALSLLLFRFSKTDEKYTKEYINQLEEDIDEMVEELQGEENERADMAAEDTVSTENNVSAIVSVEVVGEVV